MIMVNLPQCHIYILDKQSRTEIANSGKLSYKSTLEFAVLQTFYELMTEMVKWCEISFYSILISIVNNHVPALLILRQICCRCMLKIITRPDHYCASCFFVFCFLSWAHRRLMKWALDTGTHVTNVFARKSNSVETSLCCNSITSH